MSEEPSRIRWRMVLGLAVTFAAVHVAYALLGVRFSMKGLGFWQFIDVPLMRTRLLESCFHLHSQPPGFNLFLGVVVKLFGEAAPVAFHVIYLALGLVFYLSTYGLQRELGVSRPLAFVISTLFMASPGVILFEHHPFYTLPVATVLTLSALFFARTVERNRTGWALGFFLMLAALSWMRSLFHLVFFLAAASLLTACSHRRKQVVAAGLIFLVPVLSLYVKNTVVFGKFTTSSWAGMGLWKTVSRWLPPEDRERLIAEGKLSEISRVSWFSPLEDYPARFSEMGAHPDIPVLSQPRKSTGQLNYHHQAYIRISDQYLHDYLAVVRYRPGSVLTGLAFSWYGYFTSLSDYGHFPREGAALLAPVMAVYDTAFLGKIPVDVSKIKGMPRSLDQPRYVYVLLIFALPFLFVFALRAALKGRLGDTPMTRAEWGLVLYLCGTILYVSLIGNTFESRENNRFRFLVSPMYLALLGAFLQFRIFPWLRRIRARSRGSRP